MAFKNCLGGPLQLPFADVPFKNLRCAHFVSCPSRRNVAFSSEFIGSLTLMESLAMLKTRYSKTEALLTANSDEAVIVATDALELARVAAEAARMAASFASSLIEFDAHVPSERDLLRLERARLSEMEDKMFCYSVEEEASTSPPQPQDVGPSSDEFEDLESVGSVYRRKGEVVAVKSQRHRKRLAKRRKTAAKGDETLLSIDIAESWANKPSISRHVQVQGLHNDPIQFFLVNTGSKNSKLLTAAEEIMLSCRIQDLLMLESVKATLHSKLGRDPTLSEWAKAVHMKPGDFSARLIEDQRSKDKMIRCNFKLVVSVARKYTDKGLSLQDLVQVGSMGLVRGCEKFDPNKGFKFSTYAHWWIRQAMSRAITNQSRTVRLPLYQYDMLLQVRKIRRLLWQELGRIPQDVEVAQRAGITLERLKVLKKASRSCRSFEKPLGDTNMTFKDMIADTSLEAPVSKIGREFLRADLEGVLSTLKPREKVLLELRYGLEDGIPRTLEEIGKLFQVTRERVRQIEARAIRKLKQPDRNKVLNEYWID